METKYVYQWGVSGYLITAPAKEEFNTFVQRKGITMGVGDSTIEEAAKAFLGKYVATTAPALRFFIGTTAEFETYKRNKPILDNADKGTLTDDIAIWHTAFSTTMQMIIIFLPYSELGEKVRLKVVFDTITKYNLDLAIKDFNPDFVIPDRDKGVLATGLKEIEKYDAAIYQKMAMAVGLESSALHNEVIDAYEKEMKIIHSSHTHTDSTSTIVNNIVDGGIT